MASVIVRTEEEEQEFALAVGEKAVEIFLKKTNLNLKDNQRRQIGPLLEERFPDYATEHYQRKIKAAIKKGELGGFDRDGKHVATYKEVSNYLFKC